MGLLSKIVNCPPTGKLILKMLKRRAFKPFQIPLGKVSENQLKLLDTKLKIQRNTDIGRKLGLRDKVELQKLPITNYTFYEPLFSNPLPSFFMYPLEDYVKTRTSGTAGIEKWFMIPKKMFSKIFRETAMEGMFTVFHDGERITLEYGDNLYVNFAPRPFIGGFFLPESDKFSLVNIIPNINLSYEDKIQFFISNYKKIDAAAMLATTLYSQIMPFIEGSINLKGLNITDTFVAEIYKEEIERFTGTKIKTVYGSTELIMPTISSLQHSLGFIFDWRRGVFEFLPVNEEENEQGITASEAITMEEVEVGDSYRLICTPFDSDLIRYDTKDLFVCVAKGDDIINTDFPVFKFNRRLAKNISIQAFTRIGENELLNVLKDGKVPFVEFTARKEIDGGREFLALYLEQRGDMSVEEIQEIVHKGLYTIDRDYKDLVDFFGYVPLKIRLIPRGTFSKFFNQEITSSMKVDRIKMSDEKFRRLLAIVKGKT
jgi:hypothetical protein